MRTLMSLLRYLAITAVLVAGLIGSVYWLVQPDPSYSASARVAPIPPRIAESIERKSAPPEPTSVRLPMQEANVALTDQPAAPTFRIRELAPPPGKKQKRSPKEPAVTASDFPRPPVQTVTTARSDVPY